MTHRTNPNVEVRSIRKLSRLGTPMEPLEARTLMSASVLATPTALAATASGPTSVNLKWTETTNTATGYTLLRSVNGGSFAVASHISGAATTSFSDTSVLPNKTYAYKVEAVATGKTTAPSAAATVKTPLAAPTAVSAALGNGKKVTVTWTGNDSTATGYNVLRSTNGAAFTSIATVTGKTTTTATDSAVTDGSSYRYEVQATGTANTSAVTAPVAVSIPLTAPSSTAASASSSALVHITWTDNDSAATGYIVLRSTNGTTFTTLTTLTSGTAASFSDSAVAPFTTYYYEIEAKTSALTSAASSIGSTKTPLATPTAVTVVSATASSTSIKWTDTDTAAEGYYILRAAGSGSFSQVGQVNSGKTLTFTDGNAHSNTSYSYEIESYNGNVLSAASSAVTFSTPLATPTGLLATTLSSTSVQLTWTDNDTSATGYTVLRASDGHAFANVATVSSGTAVSFTDTPPSGHMYNYSIVATAGNNSSAMSGLSTTFTPLVAPSGLTATALSASSVKLTWTDNDTAATGYKILRSTDGTNFNLLATVTGATATTATDTTALANHTYYYQVQAINGTYSSSAPTSAATVTTPMLSPTKLTASVVGSWINLAWTDNDSTATGYTILRSTDGVNYSTLTTLTSGTATSYADSTVTTGQKYYYQVQATAGSASSAVSAAASATVVASTSTSTVAITTRYTDELVITSTGQTDSISITESGTTLSITANGTTVTDPAPAAGVFLYTRGGSDGINIDQSVTSPLTIETIDGATDDITSAGTHVTAWVDSTDIYTGTGTVHAVSAFEGGTAKTTGTALANPKDAGKTQKMNASLFGTGPVAGDVNQGGVGDCYFLSSLAAFAGTDPSVIEQSAVDMGDGTYTVQFFNNQNKPVFVRVSNDISTGNYWGYEDARPGTTGDVWALVMEKAFAEFRTGANTYASISGGWMGDVYSELGQANNYFVPSNYSESQLYTMLSNELANGKAVTFGTNNAPNLVSGHAYTLVSCSIDSSGHTTYVVRNPWGISGDSLENSQGYATLTYAQLTANFVDGAQAA